MPTWLTWLLALIVLDATVGRWLLRIFTTTFRLTELPGDSPESGEINVYFPGTLFDGVESVSAIKDVFLEGVSRALFVSYGFHRFIGKRVINKTAEAIGYSDDPRHANRPITQINLIGASFGGRVSAMLSFRLITKYGWDPSRFNINMIDTPCEINSFMMPGRTVSQVFRYLYFGPLFSFVLLPVVWLSLVPPREDETEEGLDYKRVKQATRWRMFKFRLSAITDQQRFLATDDIEWTLGLKGVNIVYTMNTFGNVTVIQPAAMRKIWLYAHTVAKSFTVHEVATPHCAFEQLPTKSAEGIRHALRSLRAASTMDRTV